MDLRVITRPTTLFWLFPNRFVTDGLYWRHFDFERWTAEKYEWQQDKYGGYLDYTRDPYKTVQSGRGDCEDYALVGLNWALARDEDGVGIGVCGSYRFGVPIVEHVVLYTYTTVYSSGVIYRNTTPDDYLEHSEYEWLWERPIE